MTYEDAVCNALQGRCVPYRKETKSKLKELLTIAKEFDENLRRNKMSKFNVGDKFEIEIAEVFKGAESGNDKYRIKGFDNLVFDDKGLEKIKQTYKSEVEPETKPEVKIGDVVKLSGLHVHGGSIYAVVVNTAEESFSALQSDGVLAIVPLDSDDYTLTELKSDISEMYEQLKHIDEKSEKD